MSLDLDLLEREADYLAQLWSDSAEWWELRTPNLHGRKYYHQCSRAR